MYTTSPQLQLLHAIFHLGAITASELFFTLSLFVTFCIVSSFLVDSNIQLADLPVATTSAKNETEQPQIPVDSKNEPEKFEGLFSLRY